LSVRDREKQVGVSMSAVDQNCSGTRWETVLHTNSVGHPVRHVVEPIISGKADLFERGVVAIDDHAVPDHCATKEFDRRVLVFQRKTSYSRSLWDASQNSAVNTVRSLAEPPPELQPAFLNKFEQLCDVVCAVVRVQKCVR